MAAMIRPALRMDASKVEEVLGAIRRAAQEWEADGWGEAEWRAKVDKILGHYQNSLQNEKPLTTVVYNG